MRTPDMYMSKPIAGPGAKGTIDIDAPFAENVRTIAKAKDCRPEEITVAVLDRNRHENPLEEIRKTGARFQIRPEGDATPAIVVGMRGAEVHAIIGIGVALEGILAAAAIECPGGEMQARMRPTQRSQVDKIREHGFDDPERKPTPDDLIREDDVVFAATGITSGEPSNGVRNFRGSVDTHGRDAHGTPCGKIYGYSLCPRARSRAKGIPTPTTPRTDFATAVPVSQNKKDGASA